MPKALFNFNKELIDQNNLAKGLQKLIEIIKSDPL